MKVSELTGVQLDWAVATAEGGVGFIYDGITWSFTLRGELKVLAKGWAASMMFCPSTDWAHGGPIIEREKVTLSYDEDGQTYSAYVSLFRQRGMSNRTRWRSGPTPLIAAMRCFCASRLGDEVDIPQELL